MSTSEDRPGSYWYADDDARSTSVMEAMRSYRAAEVAMRRRTQQSMDMGENELLVLRFLAHCMITSGVIIAATVIVTCHAIVLFSNNLGRLRGQVRTLISGRACGRIS